MMDQKSIANHRKALIDALEIWWDETAHEQDIPLVGENTISLMADAALNVLIAISDTQDYLRSEGMLKEDA